MNVVYDVPRTKYLLSLKKYTLSRIAEERGVELSTVSAALGGLRKSRKSLEAIECVIGPIPVKSPTN